jgi:hypothetical protein
MTMNRCKKYSDWIADAATGGLAPSREPELLAHAAACEACRKAYQHARELAAFVDRGVESLVSGDPSAHFNTRLRARIAEERAAVRFNWAAWAPIAVGSLALAALLVVLLSRAPQHNSSPLAGNHEERAPGSSQTSNPSSAAPKTSLQPRTAFAITSRRRSANRARSQPHEPEVLVPAGQLAAIMQFAAAIRSGHIDSDKLLAAQDQINAPLEIKPIEIVPLTPPQPDVAPEAAEGSGRP